MKGGVPDMDGLTVALLLFRAQGLYYGVPAFQVLRSAHEPWDPERILPGLPWTLAQDVKRENTGLFLHTTGEKPYSVPIEGMEDVVDASLSRIRPFPDWLEPCVLLRGVWGVFLRNGRLYILLDFARVLGQKDCHGFIGT